MHHRVEVLQQQLRLDVLADVRVADELDAFLLHVLDAAQHDVLLVELHVRNAVHQQAAGAILALEHRHRVARAVQLRGGRKTRRARADHRDFLAGARRGRFGNRPSPAPSPCR